MQFYYFTHAEHSYRLNIGLKTAAQILKAATRQFIRTTGLLKKFLKT